MKTERKGRAIIALIQIILIIPSFFSNGGPKLIELRKLITECAVYCRIPHRMPCSS